MDRRQGAVRHPLRGPLRQCLINAAPHEIPDSPAVEELDQMRRLAAFRQHLEECFEYPGSAESPKPLPYAVPFAVLVGKRTPSDAVNRDVVNGLQEFPIVVPWLPPARLRCIEHLQRDRPIPLRHPRQHGRLPFAGHSLIRTNPDSGIPPITPPPNRPHGLAILPIDCTPNDYCPSSRDN